MILNFADLNPEPPAVPAPADGGIEPVAREPPDAGRPAAVLVAPEETPAASCPGAPTRGDALVGAAPEDGVPPRDGSVLVDDVPIREELMSDGVPDRGDSAEGATPELAPIPLNDLPAAAGDASGESPGRGELKGCARPVSYTHLTLPTKRIV